MVIAVSFTELALPTVNRVLNTYMALDLGAPDVIAIIVGLVLAVGVLAGAYPAFVLSSYRPGAVLKGVGGTTDTTSRIRQGLVVGQFMLLIALLSVTLVVYRQQVLLTRGHLSYDPSNVAVMTGTCPPALRDGLAGTGGVTGVSCTGVETLNVQGLGYKAALSDGGTVAISGQRVDAAFLPLFHIQALAGRLFDPARASDQGAGAGNTVILNETAVHALGWSRPEEAVGRTVRLSFQDDQAPVEVIGVVPDFTMGSVEERIPATAFRLRGRAIDAAEDSLIYLKLAGGAPAATLAAVDEVRRRTNPGQPTDRFFFDDHLAMLTLLIRLETQIFTLFSVVNLLMACAGIYGLSAFTAERRTKEIGVRKVYGASVPDIVRLLLWQFAKPVLLAGVLVWIPTYLGLRHWLDSFANHVEIGPFSLLAPIAVALVIAGLTVGGQSIRVARAKPIRALRYE